MPEIGAALEHGQVGGANGEVDQHGLSDGKILFLGEVAGPTSGRPAGPPGIDPFRLQIALSGRGARFTCQVHDRTPSQIGRQPRAGLLAEVPGFAFLAGEPLTKSNGILPIHITSPDCRRAKACR